MDGFLDGTLAASMRLFGDCGDRLGEALALHALGIVRLRQGRPRDALDHLSITLEWLGPEAPDVWRARTLRELAHAHAALGDEEKARVLRKEALVLFGDRREADEVAEESTG